MAVETAEAIVARLVALSVATATGSGTNVFESRLPTSPDVALAVRAISGRKADRAFGESIPAVRENPNVQILIRHTTIAGANTLIDAIRDGFDFKTWTATGGEEFFTQFAYDPMDLGEDENQREVRSVTLEVKRTR